MTDKLTEAAAWMADLRMRRNGLIPPQPDLPEALRPADLDEGYAMQAALVARLAADLGPGAGYKIALTSKVMQDYIGHPAPVYGQLLEREIRRGDTVLKASEFRRPGLECEIAARLDAPLPAGADDAAALAALAAVMCSVEIVEERYADFRDISIATLAADNAFTRGVILGAETDPAALGDLAAQEGGFVVDGVAGARGAGAAILGGPLTALRWLADARGGLDAGALVTLGSVVKTIYPEPGQTVVAGFSGLPGVEIRIV